MKRRGPYGTYNNRFSSAKKIPRTTTLSRQSAKEKDHHFMIHDRIEDKVEAKNKENIANIQNVQELENNSMEDVDKSLDLLSSLMNTTVEPEITHDRNSKQDNSAECKNKFCNPCCLCQKTNVGDALLMCLRLAMRHSLTWSALIDTLRMINCIVGKEVLPASKYQLRKSMYDIKSDALSYHIHCSQCNKYIEKSNSKKNLKNVTCSCGSSVDCADSFFIEIDVQDQLKLLLSDDKIIDALQYRFNRKKVNNDNLEDIYDGRVYKEYMNKQEFLNSKWDLSYIFNTDGCQAADASKITVWPIYIMLNELPPDLRRKNMILIGLWVAKNEPDMLMYLQPFVKQANKLSSEGVTWKLKGTNIVSRLTPLGCCVDSVARPAMLHMKLFNGINGCTFCEQQTEPVNGIRKYTIQQNPPKLRTDESIKVQMIEAHRSNTDIVGVWGPSPLMNLHHFNLVDGMIVDFLHACLLGVIKLHTSILLSNAKEEYYIGSPNKIQIINGRLLSISPPKCVGKIPRNIRDFNIWKGSEWLLWLIFYCLICLKDILPLKYLKHLALFVTAMNIYLEESISPAMIQYARRLLITYVVNFEILYGKQYMNYNIHLLLHLSDTVENWGPLWADNTFPFESENQKLLKMKKSNYRIAEQIIYRMLLYQKVPILEAENCISNEAKEFCNSLKNKKLKNFHQVGNCILVGRGKPSLLSVAESECLQEIMNVYNITECHRFNRIIVEGIRYTSIYYKKCKKTCDYFVQTKDNQFGLISNIYKVQYSNQYDVILFVKTVKNLNRSLINDNVPKVDHIKQISNNIDQLKAFSFKMLKCTCIFSQIENKLYIANISKGCLSTNH